MVLLRDFPYSSACFGLVSYHEPWGLSNLLEVPRLTTTTPPKKEHGSIKLQGVETFSLVLWRWQLNNLFCFMFLQSITVITTLPQIRLKKTCLIGNNQNSNSYVRTPTAGPNRPLKVSLENVACLPTHLNSETQKLFKTFECQPKDWSI